MMRIASICSFQQNGLATVGVALLVLFGVSACSGQDSLPDAANSTSTHEGQAKSTAQIGEYVVELFEDKQGNLWFGTIAKGAARFDGKELEYFTAAHGLSGDSVVSIVQDKDGSLWFGTHSGLTRYDGHTFTRFTAQDGLCDDRVSNLLIDRSGTLWIGTWGGVCRYNGEVFKRFSIPRPNVKSLPYQTTMNWVTEMIEDQEGNIWFGRDGFGACRYDGESFRHFTKAEGLPSNCVQAIFEDSAGDIWFGCRVAERDNPDVSGRTGDGGLSCYDGTTIARFPEIEGLNKNDVYSIGEDSHGNIWIGATRLGVYRYDGREFVLFVESEAQDAGRTRGVQAILEDRHGKLWFACSGGLLRLDGATLVNVTVSGPWDY